MKNLFFNTKKNVLKLNDVLTNLEQSLPKYVNSINPLTDIVSFFNLISKIQDKGEVAQLLSDIQKNRPNHAVIVSLENLQKVIIISGRESGGFNRTEPGEVVSAENIFLGNISGIWTKKVSFWKSQKEDDTTRLIKGQAKKFMKINATLMLESISGIREKIA